MKLLTKLSSGISLGVVLGYLYYYKKQKRANFYLKHGQSQIKDLKNSLQNVKTSIQQLKAKSPLLKFNHLLTKWQTLRMEQLRLQKAIKKLRSRNQN